MKAKPLRLAFQGLQGTPWLCSVLQAVPGMPGDRRMGAWLGGRVCVSGGLVGGRVCGGRVVRRQDVCVCGGLGGGVWGRG